MQTNLSRERQIAQRHAVAVRSDVFEQDAQPFGTELGREPFRAERLAVARPGLS